MEFQELLVQEYLLIKMEIPTHILEEKIAILVVDTQQSIMSETQIIIDGSPTSERGLILFKDIIERIQSSSRESNNKERKSNFLCFRYRRSGRCLSNLRKLDRKSSNIITDYLELLGVLQGSGSPSRSIIISDSFTASSIGKYTINVTNSLKDWVSGSGNYGWIFNTPTSNGINI